MCYEEDDDECVFKADSRALEGRRQGNDCHEQIWECCEFAYPHKSSINPAGHVTLSHKNAHINLPSYPQRKIYSSEIALEEHKRLNGALSYDSANVLLIKTDTNGESSWKWIWIVQHRW